MEELDLKELFNLFWNKKVQIILIVVIFAMIGAIYTIGFVTPMYSSSTTLVLAKIENLTGIVETTNSITTTEVAINANLVTTYSELIKSKNILRQVISNLGLRISEGSLRGNISVNSVKDTELIEITVSNENATYAAKVANEIAKVFTEKVEEYYNINNVHIVDEAEVSNAPSNIHHVKDVILFAAIGMAVAVAYVLIINMLDVTIKSTEDIEKGFGIPVIASIPLIESFENEKGGKK